MADGYLEKHQAEYEARRDAFLHHKGTYRKKGAKRAPSIPRPDDEAL